MEKSKPEQVQHKVSLIEFVLAVEEKIQESLVETGVRGISEPFEMIIDEKSLDIESLGRYAALPIEVIMQHDGNGKLILSTGSKDNSGYNFGPHKLKLLEDLFEMPVKEIIEKSKEYARIIGDLGNYQKADSVQQLRKYNEQPYIIHQHPSGKLLPSIEDLLFLQTAKSIHNIIFTKEGAVLYDASGEVVAKLMDQLEYYKKSSPEELEEFLTKFYNDNNIVLKVFRFEDEDFEILLKYLRSDIDLESFKSLCQV